MDHKWRIRTYREDDIPAITTLINISDEAVGMPPRVSEEGLTDQFNASKLDPLRQVLVAEGPKDAASGQVVIGYGRAFPSGGIGSERVYNLSMRVHPLASHSGLAYEIAEQLVVIVRRHEALPDQ